MELLNMWIRCLAWSKPGLFIAFVLVIFSATAQQQDAIWVFGQNAGIDFRDTANPVAFRSKTYSFENTASIADSNGNLLFYVGKITSAMTVNSANFQIIPNGDINTQTHGKGTIILPTENARKYQIFHIGAKQGGQCTPGWCTVLYRTIVELDSSGWRIAIKNIEISPLIVEEGISAVKHSNGKDWWLVLHRRQTPQDTLCNNTFYRYLVTSDTLIGPDSQNIGILNCDSHLGRFGVIRYNANLNKLTYGNLNLRRVELFTFDRCSGLLSNTAVVDNGILPYSIEFSPSGKYLYVVSDSAYINYPSNSKGQLFQYDLEAPNIAASKVEIWNDANRPNVPGQLQLAPDGKIYMAYSTWESPILSTNSTMKALSYINQPDSLGIQCDFRPFAFPLADSTYSHMSLPNMPNYNLGPQGIFLATAGDDTVYCPVRDTAGTRLGNPALPHVVYRWYPSIGLDDTTVAQPLATPTQSTWYYLTATDTTASTCGINYDSVYVEFKDCGVGVNNITSETLANVYPNPTTGTLHIETPTPTGHISLYNLLGGEVLAQPLTGTHTTLDVSVLPPGVYLYRIEAEGKMQSGRVVVQ